MENKLSCKAITQQITYPKIILLLVMFLSINGTEAIAFKKDNET